MSSEHDVKYDSDVILALSVMSSREKQHIIQSSMTRLQEVSNNQTPSSGESLLPRPAPASSSSPSVSTPSKAAQRPVMAPAVAVRGRGVSMTSLPRAPPLSSRGRGTSSYQRGGARPVRPAAAASGSKVPFSIQNMSISISVVDQTVKCSQCTMTFKNSNLLAEHTKTVHLARFASLGLSITAPGEKKTPDSSSVTQGSFQKSKICNLKHIFVSVQN